MELKFNQCRSIEFSIMDAVSQKLFGVQMVQIVLEL